MAADITSALLGGTMARSGVLSVVSDEQKRFETHGSILRRTDETERHVLMVTPTPYGSVLQEIPVPRDDGSTFRMLFCRPKALVWLAVRLSSAFGHFLHTHIFRGAQSESLCRWTTSVQAIQTDQTTGGPTMRGTGP